MRNVDVVLFDKTGTLTSATHRLTSIYTRRGDDDRVLALERMRNADVGLFDQTGTLTSATPRLTSIYTRRGDDDRVLALAAAVEAESEHPVARAVVEAASELGGVPAASGFRAMSGRGV